MVTKIAKTTLSTAAAVKPVAVTKAPVAKKMTLGKTVPSAQTKLATTKTAMPKVAIPKTAPKVVVVAAKVKKPKLVRDSFTMPKDEYTVIDSLKLRAGKLGQSAKKSELLRAGIKVLAAMSDIQFKAALSAVPTLKTGRPKDIK